MKLWVLEENTSCRQDVTAEHGLSLYLETGNHKILFDMGQSDAFLHNAQVMGVDLRQVDLAVLSHGHYDHGGGLQAFLQWNDHAKVYVNQNAFGEYYNGTEKYIGLDPALEKSGRLIPVGEELQLDAGLRLLTCNDRACGFPVNSYGLNVRQGGDFMPDPFRHEQYLEITEGDRRILLSGCSHKGILNIAEWFSPDVLIGGFHFKKLDPEGEGRQTLEQAAQQLRKYPTRYYTCHCTGVSQYEYLKQKMGQQLSYLSAGTYLEIDKQPG